MNIIALRAAAFAVGTMVAGCVFTSGNASSKATPPSAVAVYPGAHRTSGNPDGDSADVDLKMPMVSLHIEALRYDSADAPAKIVAFYRKELAKLGDVSESRGGPHTSIRGFRWKSADDQTTLEAGHIVVAVKPQGSGSEFGLIDIGVAAPKQDQGG